MRRFPTMLAAVLTACAAPPPAPPPPAAPAAPGTAAPYEAWEITSSALEIRVYRDGPMARLGHNHLVTSSGIGGRIELREPRARSGFTLALPLASLAVDDPGARAAAGPEFAAAVPEADRAGTARNLFGPQVLDAALQPVLRLHAEALEGGPRDYRARVRIALRGEERVVEFPVTVELEGATLRVHAQAVLRHADFGLVPFRIAAGALSVRDEIAIDCRLEARRAS
jgi:polyisoprenoid-binding protein YceI